jgi:hypothetical protein
MNRLATIRAAILAAVRAVPDIGQVHDRERYVREEAKFKALFMVERPGGRQQLRGWWIRRSATEERVINIARTVAVDTWTLRGYMALEDDSATELAFDDLIEALRDQVRSDPTFGGVCALNPFDDPAEGIQVMDAGPVNFCGVLCHSAVLQLRTWSYIE